VKLKKISFFRLFSSNRKEPFLSFYQVLGFYPQKIELYELAMRHKSSSITENGKKLNNERLEFLGDAILNAVIADILYSKFENQEEGFLTNVRSNIVKRETLNEICKEIGLDHLIVADKNVKIDANSNILGNTLEALIGTVYLDCGFYKCKNFIVNHLLVSSNNTKKWLEENDNYKSELLEYCQKNRLELTYELKEEILNDDNSHTFVSLAIIEGKVIGEGKGSSKKESQQEASKIALHAIYQQITNQ